MATKALQDADFTNAVNLAGGTAGLDNGRPPHRQVSLWH